MAYTKESFKIDIAYLKGYGMKVWEADEFIKNIIKLSGGKVV